MHSKSIRLVLALFCSLITLSLLTADDLRTWTDSTGQHTIEAKFIGLEGGKVILEKADGSRIQIEMSKLKAEDRTEAMKLNAKKMTENPFKNAGDNPFKSTNTKAGSRAKNTTEPDPNAPTPATVDWNAAKQLSIFGSEWKPPTFATSDTKLSWQPRPVSFTSKDFWDKPTGIVASASAKRAVVISAMDKPGNKDNAVSTLYLCDLEKGTAIKSFSVSGKFTPLALSPDGTQVIARQDVFGHNQSNFVEFWKLDDSKLARLHRWEAGRPEDRQGCDVHGASFLGDGKTILTWLSGGLLTWWNAADLKTLQTLQLQGNCVPTLTHDQKYIIAKSNNDLVILDAMTGDTVSVKPLPQAMHSRFVVSPDGKQIAGVAINKIEIFDVPSANLSTSISISGFGADTPCFWASPKMLLAGQPLCYVAPEMNINVWAYDGIEKLTPLGDQVLTLTGGAGNKGFTLVPLKLPHASALQMIEQAKNDPNFFILKPGSTVRIDAGKITDPALQEEVVDALGKKLQDMGMKVGSGSIVLTAGVEKSKDHEVAYHGFPRLGFGREKTHTVPGWSYHLKLVADGRTHWTTTGGNHPPPLIHLKEGETIDQHLKKYGTPSASYFKHVELPNYVARAQTDQAGGSTSLRRSQVTPNGIR